MLLEHCTISRKTPRDGKIEITQKAAERLLPCGQQFQLSVFDQAGSASLSTFECACRGAERPHVHYFLASPLFLGLIPGSEVRVEWDESSHLLIVASP